MRRYLEIAVIVIVISLLVGGLMTALEDAHERTEAARLNAEEAAIRTQIMEVLTHRETYGGPLPQSDNPVDWIRVPPAGYQGVHAQAPTGENFWYFDSTQRQLIHVGRNGKITKFHLSRQANSNTRGIIAKIGLERLE